MEKESSASCSVLKYRVSLCSWFYETKNRTKGARKSNKLQNNAMKYEKTLGLFKKILTDIKEKKNQFKHI